MHRRIVYTVTFNVYNVHCTLYIRPVRSIQFVILHIKYNTYLYFSIICISNLYKKNSYLWSRSI